MRFWFRKGGVFCFLISSFPSIVPARGECPEPRFYTSIHYPIHYPLSFRPFPHISTAVSNPSIPAQLLQIPRLPAASFESAPPVRMTYSVHSQTSRHCANTLLPFFMFRPTTPSASSPSRSCNPHSSPLSLHSAPGARCDLVEAAKFPPFILATRHTFALSHEGPLAPASLSSFPATLTVDLQLTENPATLSPAAATLTCRVTRNSCVCHSYKKLPGSHLSSQRSLR